MDIRKPPEVAAPVSYRTVFLVQSNETLQFLNRQGSWSRYPTSYRLAEFESAEAAQAAFPAGVACTVIQHSLRNPVEVK